MWRVHAFSNSILLSVARPSDASVSGGALVSVRLVISASLPQGRHRSFEAGPGDDLHDAISSHLGRRVALPIAAVGLARLGRRASVSRARARPSRLGLPRALGRRAWPHSCPTVQLRTLARRLLFC